MASPAAISSSLVLLLVTFTAGADATSFFVNNRCPFTVWAAAILIRSIGGGAQLAPAMTWHFEVDIDVTGGRVWPRTGCSFDYSTGRGGCRTGDCGGALSCFLSGKPPATLAEFTIGYGGAPDSYGISVVDGFNVPMDFSCSAADVIRCRDPGCPDANHSPNDGKYHKCQGNATYELRYEDFCP